VPMVTKNKCTVQWSPHNKYYCLMMAHVWPKRSNDNKYTFKYM
jgi:hypothetical protein